MDAETVAAIAVEAIDEAAGVKLRLPAWPKDAAGNFTPKQPGKPLDAPADDAHMHGPIPPDDGMRRDVWR